MVGAGFRSLNINPLLILNLSFLSSSPAPFIYKECRMLNDIIIQGYLGRDPELTEQQGQNGTYKRVTFSVGVGRDFGDETDWFFCTMNGKRAEVIEKYFKKGSEIIVSGRMESYKPKNKPDTTAWLLKMDNFWFTRNGTKSGQKPADIPDGFTEIDDDGDVPF